MNELQNIESNLDLDLNHFGNAPLKQIKKVEEALVKCEKSMQTWSRSHSNFTWKLMTIGNEYTLTRQLRQISAQLNHKKAALVENKYKYLKKLKRAEKKECEAAKLIINDVDEEEKESVKLQKEYLLLEAEELRANAELVYNPAMGAAKDVIELTKLHDAIIQQIIEKHGKFDEEVFEIEETEYWIKRSFTQSLRDIRERNTISKGEQELLEHIGLDPLAIEALLKSYLHTTEKTLHNDDVNVSIYRQEEFLNKQVEEFAQASKEALKRKGLPMEIDTETLLLDSKDKGDHSP